MKNNPITAMIRSQLGGDFFRYLVAGGSAALVNWFTFYVFHYLLSLPYIVSGIGAFIVAWVVNTTITLTYVFPDRRRFSRNTSYLLLFVVSGIGAIIDVSLLGFFYRGIGLPGMVSKIIASGLALLWNFAARRFFIFAPDREEAAKEPAKHFLDPPWLLVAKGRKVRLLTLFLVSSVTLLALVTVQQRLNRAGADYGWNHILPIGDSAEYHRFGANLANGRGFSYEVADESILTAFSGADGKLRPQFAYMEKWIVDKDGDLSPTAARSPGFPLLLSMVYFIFGENGVAAQRVLQCLLAGLTALFVGVVAWRIRPGFFAAAAALLVAMDDLLYRFASRILTESWAVVFVALTFAAMIANKKKSPWLDALAGAVLAADLLIRPNHGFILPLYGLFILFETKGWMARIKRGAAFSIALLLVLSPWIIRNYQHFDAIIPFSTQSGQTLASYHCDEAHRLRGGWGREISPEASAKLESMTDPIERKNYFMSLFKTWVAENPQKLMELYGWRSYKAWFTGLYQVANEKIIITRLPFTLALILVPFGLYYGRRERWVRIGFVFLLAYWLSSLPFLQVPRYLHHFIAVIALLAARGALGLLDPGCTCDDVMEKENRHERI